MHFCSRWRDHWELLREMLGIFLTPDLECLLCKTNGLTEDKSSASEAG